MTPLKLVCVVCTVPSGMYEVLHFLNQYVLKVNVSDNFYKSETCSSGQRIYVQMAQKVSIELPGQSLHTTILSFLDLLWV